MATAAATMEGRALSGGDSGGWEYDPSSGGLFVLVAMLAGIICRTALKHVRERFNLPFTVLVLVMGAIYAVIADNVNLGALSHSLDVWVNINPHHLLFLFFPALIFGFAFQVSFHVFLREAPIILALAVPGVLLATLLTGLCRGSAKLTQLLPCKLADSNVGCAGATQPLLSLGCFPTAGTSQHACALAPCCPQQILCPW